MTSPHATVDYRMGEGKGAGIGRILIAVGAAAAVAAGAIGLFSSAAVAHHFKYAYLVAFMFWLSVVLGGLFFVMIHHLTGARWSVVVRRIAEAVAMNAWLMAILFIPILLWLPTMYEWAWPESRAAEVANAALLAIKRPYLNVPFFVLRAVIYFTVWIGLATIMWRTSVAQDTSGKTEPLESLRKLSAPGMILFALTLTFAAFDWMMTLDPYWYSTIFGVYYFAGSVLAIFATLILLALLLNGTGALAGAVTTEHYHDMGKMLFAFVVFWAYIAFSQLLLIWMANIPEETIWFFHRWSDPAWQQWSWLLVIGHFAAPFLYLLPRGVKRLPPLLALGALWMLFMHWADLTWLIMPVPHEHGVPGGLLLIDALLMVAMGLLFVGLVLIRLRRQALVPVRDPHLAESLAFENV